MPTTHARITASSPSNGRLEWGNAHSATRVLSATLRLCRCPGVVRRRPPHGTVPAPETIGSGGDRNEHQRRCDRGRRVGELVGSGLLCWPSYFVCRRWGNGRGSQRPSAWRDACGHLSALCQWDDVGGQGPAREMSRGNQGFNEFPDNSCTTISCAERFVPAILKRGGAEARLGKLLTAVCAGNTG